VRPDWLSLNGEWEFEEDRDLSGLDRGLCCGHPLSGRIVVPFAPESRLSGLGKTEFMPAVWYRRTFRPPDEWQGRRVLHFGAVDYETTVWVNGRLGGSHRGGYSPFEFDITPHLRDGDNELVVRAIDDTGSALQPSGKQSERPESYGCLYTRTTGIWQTVWLEAAPAVRLERARFLPDVQRSRLSVVVQTTDAASDHVVIAVARAEGAEVAKVGADVQGGAAALDLDLGEARAWSPDDPFLYDLELHLTAGDSLVDRVESYFGMRQIDLESPAILLNGRPLFQRLVLDQGYYPDGIYTAPDDDALRRDIDLSQAMGFNGARLHQKVFEPRFLYWADRLGYLVWGEYPSWGLDISLPDALASILPEWLAVVQRDFNHPSVVGWGPLNETRHEPTPALVPAVYWATKQLDPTRPVIDTSGYVHAVTDVDDCHSYEQDPEKFAALFAAFAGDGEPFRNSAFDAPHRGQPYFVSEYGGVWWNPGQTDDKAWGYGDRPKTEEEFLARYRALTEAILLHPKICGFCYTQLYDIEQEVNGLYSYDRKPKFDPAVIRAINEQEAAVEGR
jgi:beta-galactosidase/beta-glucuronidase